MLTEVLKLKKLKILITGHHGLIGHKLYEMLKVKHDVDGIDSKCKMQDTSFLMNKKFDLIIHCGANCVIRDIIKDPELAKENIDFTYEVLEYARRTGCKKVVIFSSSRVHHMHNNPYVASKKFSEDMALAYKECYGIDTVIFRPETVWGLNDNPVRVIPKWIHNAFHNENIIIYGDKNKELSPIHVDDFCSEALYIISQFIKKSSMRNVYYITGMIMKACDIAEIIVRVTGASSRIIYLPAEKSQPQQCPIPDIVVDNFNQSLIEAIDEMKLL